MDLATYQTLANVVNTTFGKTSQIGKDHIYLTVKILGFVSKNPDIPHASQKDPQYKEENVIKLIVNTTISDRFPESKKNGLRMEAMEIVKQALIRIGKEYKELVKTNKEIKKKTGSILPDPKSSIEFKLKPDTLFDDITLTQATLYSAVKTGIYRMEIIASIEI